MEELKSCLFCGKYIDKSYLYCPYCGYEFGRREDNVDFVDESTGEIISDFLPFAGGRLEAEERQSQEVPPETASPTEEKKEGIVEYLARLQDMEKLLAEMERELDLILSGAQAKAHAKGPVTSSSKGP